MVFGSTILVVKHLILKGCFFHCHKKNWVVFYTTQNLHKFRERKLEAIVSSLYRDRLFSLRGQFALRILRCVLIQRHLLDLACITSRIKLLVAV